jgi:hypothetical protein
MNSLNSVLFEGTVSSRPDFAERGKEKVCSFTVSAWRDYYSSKGDCIRRVGGATIRIVIRDTKLVEAAVRNAHDGRALRIVGKLAGSVEDNSICIVAEHVEYRPERTLSTDT